MRKNEITFVLTSASLAFAVFGAIWNRSVRNGAYFELFVTKIRGLENAPPPDRDNALSFLMDKVTRLILLVRAIASENTYRFEV